MSSVKLFLLFIATCLLLFPTLIVGQTKPAPSPEPDDVIKF